MMSYGDYSNSPQVQKNLYQKLNLETLIYTVIVNG